MHTPVFVGLFGWVRNQYGVLTVNVFNQAWLWNCQCGLSPSVRTLIVVVTLALTMKKQKSITQVFDNYLSCSGIKLQGFVSATMLTFCDQ